MRGRMHTATIWTRSGGTWVDSDETIRGRLQPLSETIRMNARWPLATHLFIADASPVLDEGTRLDIDSVSYYIHGAQMHDRPGVGHHHQELYIASSEA